MSVHYKFKAALDYSTVTFDGIHISVGDLKKEIIEQKRLAKNADFDLQIQNAQTKEVYQDEITLIPKNTSVIVARVPIADKKKSGGGGGGGGGGGPGGGRDGGRFAAMQRNHLASLPPAALSKGVDLATMDMTEEEKIKAMMSQATADYDPSRYMKIRGSNQHGRVPDNYRCYKCNNAGHWIKNCPMVSHDSSDVKKSTGIPRSFMVMVEGPEVPGALITPEGQYAVPAIDREAYSTKNKPAAEPVQKPKIPEELICPICQDLLTDALLVPCCANSYCDECIRNTLLESDDLECPGCHEKDTSPNELIPNRFLRTAVNAFKNETGYSKPSKLPDKKDKESHKEAQAAAAESRKVSLEELPEDLFPHSPRKIDPESEQEQVDSSKADDVNSSDLYDFNDGSIPSPFAIQDNATSNSTSAKEPPPREMELRPPPGAPPHYHGPPPMHSHPRGDYNDYRGPPPNYNRGPPHHPYGPPPSQHHQGDRDRDRDREPPPPGFGDVMPPGEERMQLPPQMRHPSGPPPHHMMGPGPGPRDDRQGPPPPGPGGPPPLMQGPPPPGAFMQPPPGYGPPGSMHRPPPMGGPPPPGPFPPNQYPPNFNRMPPPPGDPMYPPGPYPLMDSRHRDRDRDRERDRVDRDRDRGRDRDRERDDFDRGRGPPRRPFHRDGPGPVRIGGRLPGDENRPGPIEDPLKEFERLMREKDRRKQQMTGALKKRSKSRSGSPLPRRSQSPHLRKRTRSPSFPRSPSPKRKRTLPILKRRNSYSRSRSRTPPQPVRRAPRSRSRSRERDRNRSGSPHFPKRVDRERDRDRRSPRRAPPFSPSPPPSSRYPKKEKDEYFRDEHQSRYDDRHPRYSSSSSSKHHSSRDYDGSSKYEGSSKYDGASKYENAGKYDERYDEKYPPEKYDSGASRHDPHHSSSSNRYDYSSKSSSRNYHSTSHRGAAASSGPLPASPGGQRDRDKPYFDSNQNSSSRRPYEFEPVLAPPGTDSAPVPSLLDINVDIPPGMRNMDYHNDSRGGPSDLMEKSDHKFSVEIKTKKEDEVPVQDKETTEKDANLSESKKDTKEHRRRKSSEDKKLKKKKHKKEKKKDKEEKKDKKRKKSKDGEGPGDTLTGLLIDPATLETDSKADPLGSLVGVDSNNVAHDIKLTAPCDSTVKSPDRPGLHKDTVDVPARVGPRSTGSRLSQDDTYPPGVDEPIENAYISLRGVVMSDLTKQPPCIKDIEKNSEGASEDQSFVVPMPASKWDEFDENDDSNTTYASKVDTPLGDSNDKPSKDFQASRVPADVIRRAENVIFEKPITVQTISVMVTTEMNEQGKKSPTPMKKITLSDIGTLPPEDLKDTGKESDGDSKHGKSVVASAVFRRPLKDRLGSKVSEDEAVRTPKEDDNRVVGSSSRSRRTPPRDSRDRRRSKSKSPVRGDKSRRERSRSARREKSRSPARRPKSRTPPRRERDERRGRSRSLQRRERSRSPKTERPVHRRDRSRSPVAQRRDRSRSPVAPRRDRSRSPVAQRRDRSRSPIAQRRDRSRSRERRERERPAEPRLSDRPERRRTRSRSRDRRHNPRSPIQLPSRAGLKVRSPEPRRNFERNPDSRHEQSESSRRRRSQNRELSPPGASTRASPKRDRPSSSDSKSRSSDKARDGASGVAAAFTNEYADLKKTKQRINIKLSSTAKLERDSNSSSSDEQEGPEESLNENLTAAVLESLGTDPTTGLLDPANAAKKKKKAKKHRSSSSSSSSSSSDGKHKKKSKKSKKKKKKKKKSK